MLLRGSFRIFPPRNGLAGTGDHNLSTQDLWAQSLITQNLMDRPGGSLVSPAIGLFASGQVCGRRSAEAWSQPVRPP